LEKVRFYFPLITEHIAYTTRPRGLIRAKERPIKQKPMDSLLALKPVDEIVAHNVLQNERRCATATPLFKTCAVMRAFR
jgi:hypothetical protein